MKKGIEIRVGKQKDKNLELVWRFRKKLLKQAKIILNKASEVHEKIELYMKRVTKMNVPIETSSVSCNEGLLLVKRGELLVRIYKLYSQYNQLLVEAHTLTTLSNKIWFEAIKDNYGNIKINWVHDKNKNDYNCVLETGEIFYA